MASRPSRSEIDAGTDWLLASPKSPAVSAMSLARLEAIAASLHGAPGEAPDARSASVALHAFAKSGVSRRDPRYGEAIKRAMDVVAFDPGAIDPAGESYLDAMWITTSVLAMLELDDAPMYRVVASRRVAWVLDQLAAGCVAAPAEVRYRAIALALDIADAAVRVGLTTPARVDLARDAVRDLGEAAIGTRLEALVQGDDRPMVRSELAAAAEIVARFADPTVSSSDADVLVRRVRSALTLVEPDSAALQDDDRSAAIYWATRYSRDHLAADDWKSWGEGMQRALVAIRIVAPRCDLSERRAAAYGAATAVIVELPKADSRR